MDQFVRKLLVGDPVYANDFRVEEKVAYLGLVRSPYANARIKKVDFSTAREDKELIDFLVGADLIQQGIGAIPVEAPHSVGLITYNYLAVDNVSHVGQPVAAVLASNMYSVQDLLEKVDVEYDRSEPVCTLERAKTADALVYPTLKTNVIFSSRMSKEAHTQNKFTGNTSENVGAKEELYRISAKFAIKRQAAVPIETRVILSIYDKTGDSFIVRGTVQQTEVLRELLSQAFRISKDRITVEKTSLGGAFGAKGAAPYPEAVLGCLFARRNPDFAVKWASTRTEDLLESVQGRDKYCEIELECDKNAKIVELKANIESDVGVFEVANGNPSVLDAARLMPSVYKIPKINVNAVSYVTHKTPSGPIRDVGKSEACFFIEQAIDLLARKLLMDPVEFRKRNLILPEEFPYDNGLGHVYDSGNFSLLLQQLLKVSDYEALKEWREKTNNELLGIQNSGDAQSGKNSPASRNENGKLAGIGISLAIEANMFFRNLDAKRGEIVSETLTTFPSGAHLCALVLDVETGMIEIKKYAVVDDYGRQSNITFADGRIQGGLGREVGAALFEEIQYNDQGQLLNASLSDYMIPTAQCVPNVDSVHCETPSPLSENGSKGLGDIGSMGVMAAVFNALNDAISHVGDNKIGIAPVRPEVVREILRRSMSV